MTTFKDLGVHGNYIKALKELQIKVPTEIQEKTIPVLLKTKTDYIGLAQTGTGKTAAYGLPILNSIDTNSAVVQALILSPTRELVQQIKKQLFKFTKFNEEKIFVEAVYGGEKIDKQMQRLQRPTHIIVATPGRLIDLIEKGNVNLRSIKTVVLDEADEMLSMGFKKELDAILNYTSGSRNTWLFSATMPEEILRIISKYMEPSAVKVSVNKESLVNANISHQYLITSIKEKTTVVSQLLDKFNEGRGIIFCRTKLGVQKLVKELKEEGFGVLTEIDMKKTLKEKIDTDFKRYTILGACNPNYAYRALQDEDKIGVFLPCNVIVEEAENGNIEVSIVDPIASMMAVTNENLGAIATEVQEKLIRVIHNLK